MDNIWKLQDAKSRFSELVDRTQAQGVQIVTRRGKKTVAIIPYEEYQHLTRPAGNLVQFLLASPLAGSDLQTERQKELPRSFEIEP